MIKDEDIARKYLSKITNCKTDGTAFELSFSQYRRVVTSKKCYYTGIDLTWKAAGDDMKSTDLSVERVDNKKGYVKGNVVACSHAANKLKAVWENKQNHLTFEQVSKMVKKLKMRG